MKIGDRVIAPGQPPYVVAELGVNHDGDVKRALELVCAAAAARADAIKLQFFDADRLLSRAARLATYQQQAGASDPRAMLRSLQLSIDQMREVAACAAENALDCIVTVFSVELVRIAEEIDWDMYKVASPDIINKPLIDALIATRRPLLISTGASTLAEVKQCASWLGDHRHIFMQCVSAYPTDDEHAALAGRHALLDITPHGLGHSDHTTAIDTGALAVASGACILEKHLTYDRNARGPDHAASLDPGQFKEYVRLAHRAWRMLGPREKSVQSIEQDVRTVSRQSVTITRTLAAGHALTAADLTIKRPGTGLPPWRLESVIGRRLARAVEADVPLHEDDLADA